MPKKLKKSVEGSVITIQELISGETLTFDINDLNDITKSHLMMHGGLQKLGDAAAGREGEEAVASINTVWKGLLAGDWTIRVPAGPKVSKKLLSEKLATLSEKEQKAATAILEKLGVIL